MNVLVLKDGREQRKDKERLIHHGEGHNERSGAGLHLDFGSQKAMRKTAHDEERRIGEHRDQR